MNIQAHLPDMICLVLFGTAVHPLFLAQAVLWLIGL